MKKQRSRRRIKAPASFMDSRVPRQNFVREEAHPLFRCRNSMEEEQVVENVKSLLSWLAPWSFERVKDQLVQTIRGVPSAFVLKSLVSCIFDVALAKNAYVLFGRLCGELSLELPLIPSDESCGKDISFKRILLDKCQMEFEKATSNADRSSPVVYVHQAFRMRLVGTIQLIAELFKREMVPEKICHHIIQELMEPSCPPESNIEVIYQFVSSIGKQVDAIPQSRRVFDLYFRKLEELLQNPSLTLPSRDMIFHLQRLRGSNWEELERTNELLESCKKERDVLAREREELEKMKQLLETCKKERDDAHSQIGVWESKYNDEVGRREETEDKLARERKKLGKIKGNLKSCKKGRENLDAEVEELRSKYSEELKLRKETEDVLTREREELEKMKPLLESYKKERDNTHSQARTWKSKYDDELKLRKETEDVLARERKELQDMKTQLESCTKERDDMQEEQENAQKLIQELLKKQAEDYSLISFLHSEERQTLESFICPISQEMMKDPQTAADGFSYEGESIREWIESGHDRSPMTNVSLPHRNLVPNHTLRSAIEEWLQQFR